MTKRKHIPNPTGKNGRDPIAIELRSMARTHTEEAFHVLVDTLRNSDDPKLKMEAACHVLDRGWGKPCAGIDLMKHDSQEAVEKQGPVVIRIVGGKGDYEDDDMDDDYR